jgi:ABC-type glutathione transport system ATPase component
VLFDGERGFLCCGESGSGKSTLARLAGTRRGSDELGAVRPVDGTWTVSALPLWDARPGTARLDGVFLLRHAPSNERRRLSPAAALPALGRQLLWREEAPEAAQQAIDLLADLVERVPVWDLGFVPTTAVFELIAAPPGDRAGP